LNVEDQREKVGILGERLKELRVDFGLGSAAGPHDYKVVEPDES
jgi:hypothetical protein